MSRVKIHNQHYEVTHKEAKRIGRIIFCITQAKRGLMPPDKPYKQLEKFLACAPDLDALYRRREVAVAMNVPKEYTVK